MPATELVGTWEGQISNVESVKQQFFVLDVTLLPPIMPGVNQ